MISELGTYLSKTDEELIVLCQSENTEAYAELVRRHMEKAVHIVFCAVGNYEDAKDVAQEAFVKAYRAIKNFDSRSKFSTWMYRILMNASKDFHRKKKWRSFMTWKTGEEQDRFLGAVEAKTPGPEQGVVNEELKLKMNAAIQTLPEKQKWIFILRYVDGLSLREISELTNLSQGTVKATLHFASQKFKKAMEPYMKEGARNE